MRPAVRIALQPSGTLASGARRSTRHPPAARRRAGSRRANAWPSILDDDVAPAPVAPLARGRFLRTHTILGRR
jgi:hypothetical protein